MTAFRCSFFRRLIYCMRLVLFKWSTSTGTAQVLPADYIEWSCSSTFLICWQLFNFPVSFFSISSNNFLLLFTSIGNGYFPVFGAATHKLWVCHRLNVSKLPRMVCNYQSSLMILINIANYVHVLSICTTSSSHFILQV